MFFAKLRLTKLKFDCSFIFTKFPKSILKFSNANHKDKFHPTQKLVPLLEYLIKTYTKENETVLEISTKYFTLQYQKEKPFNGTMFAPDAFLKVSLNKSDKAWYYSHDEARNFKGFVDKLILYATNLGFKYVGEDACNGKRGC